MYDEALVRLILQQIVEALQKIQYRTSNIHQPDDFSSSPEGMEKLDAVCMLFIVIGEGLKNIDKVTNHSLFTQYPEIDWVGI